MSRSNRWLLRIGFIALVFSFTPLLMPEGRVAGYQLLAALGPESWQRWCVAKLKEAGPAGVGPLASIAADSSVELEAREEALWALSKLGRDALPALPEVLQALQHPDSSLRWAAVSVLASIGPPARERSLQPLIAAFTDRFHWVRLTASEAAGNCGAEALPDLLAALREPPRRRYAALAIGRLLGENARAVRAGEAPPIKLEPLQESLMFRELIAVLEEGESDHARHVAMIFNKLGARGAPATAELIRLLRGRPEGSYAITSCLASIGEPAAAAAPLLTERLRSPKQRRAVILRALIAIKAEHPPLLEILKAASTDPDARVRALAIRALKKGKNGSAKSR